MNGNVSSSSSGNKLLYSDSLYLIPFYLGQKIARLENGCETFHGTSEIGAHLHITKWTINLENQSTTTPDVKKTILDKVLRLSGLPHKNLVNIRSVYFSQNKENHLLVYLVRDVIYGVPINTFTKVTNWAIRNIRIIADVLLKAVSFLHQKNIFHGNISESSVFLDDEGVWKLIDFDVVPYLNRLAVVDGDGDGNSNGNGNGDVDGDGVDRGDVDGDGDDHGDAGTLMLKAKADMNAIGQLIQSFDSTASQVMDFIEKCKEATNLSELAVHPLIQNLNKSFDDFVVLGSLGSGGFGQALKVKDCNVDREYVIKRVKIIKGSSRTLAKANLEVKTLAKLNDTHIVRYYRSWVENMNESDYVSYEKNTSDEPVEDDDEAGPSRPPKQRKREIKINVLYIQLELCEQGDLKKVLDNSQTVEDSKKLQNDIPRITKYFLGIAAGLRYIHSKGVIHRDLKPENIFLNDNDIVKIGDFGLATTRKSLSKENCGTTFYRAPEIGNRGVQARADMYSLGIILFEMNYLMTNTELSYEENREAILTEIREVGAPIEPFIPPAHKFHKDIKNLLDHEVKNRMTAIELLDKPEYKKKLRELEMVSNIKTMTKKQSRHE